MNVGSTETRSTSGAEGFGQERRPGEHGLCLIVGNMTVMVTQDDDNMLINLTLDDVRREIGHKRMPREWRSIFTTTEEKIFKEVARRLRV